MKIKRTKRVDCWLLTVMSKGQFSHTYWSGPLWQYVKQYPHEPIVFAHKIAVAEFNKLKEVL